VPSDIAAGLLLVGRQHKSSYDNMATSSSHQLYGDRHNVLGKWSRWIYSKYCCSS